MDDLGTAGRIMKEARFLNRLGFLFTALTFFNGCSFTRPILEEQVGKLGRFEFREPADGLEGVVIGAPHGRTDPYSDRIARTISDRTGAGLVIAYGFKSNRLSVAQPVVRSRPYLVSSRAPLQRASVFSEYKRILWETAKGELKLYVGIHRSSEKEATDRIEVSTSGLTFEEARALEAAFSNIRDQMIQGKTVPKLLMVIEPLERISWRISAVKHHGALLIAEKGLNLRIPHVLFPKWAEELYGEILARWVDKAIRLLRENTLELPQIQVTLMDLGRFELFESRKAVSGVVLGAPHGSFDEYTAEIVKRLSYRTGLAAVIAKGFTPTEAGGWRINVNRPTEKIFHTEGFEISSQRAREVYRSFQELVFKASKGGLNLYVDIHQYNTDNMIQVATVRVSRKQARIIKMLYNEIRDRILETQSGIPAVELLIEPLESIEIGAWAAKAEGVLSLAKKSLHVEFPSHRTFASAEALETYTRIFAVLLRETVPFLLSGAVGGDTEPLGVDRVTTLD